MQFAIISINKISHFICLESFESETQTHILLSTGVWKGIGRNCASPYPVWFELIDNVILANKVPDAAGPVMLRITNI